MKREQLLNDLQKFIKLVPESILHECVGGIGFSNRSERRKFEKYRSLDSKIEALVQNKNYRINLIEQLYSKYGDLQDDDSLTYDEVISTINATNFMPKILYILHRCCDDEFDKMHFSNFIQSEPFQKTIKNEWKTVQPETSSDITLKNTFKESGTMKYYLGYIESRTTFYNFKPMFIYDDSNSKISEIDAYEITNIFPKYGSFNLAYKRYGKSYDFLKSLNVDKVDGIGDANPCARIYAVKLDEGYLEDSGNEKISKKLDLQALSEKGIELSDVIKPAADFSFYRIVTPKDDINNDSFAGIISIKERDCAADEEVLLEYDSNLFGPYKLQERFLDGEKYIRPESGVNKYILDCYGESDYEFHYYEKSDSDEPIYIAAAYVKNKPGYFDVIPDSILLTKLTDAIDFKYLYENPEDFSRIYYTSPFLEDVPEKIRNDRINRIQNILNNTLEYDEIRKKALNTLIDSLDDKKLDAKIKESTEYKELQSKVADLEREKEDLNRINEDLESKINDLNDQFEELSGAEVSTIDTERIEKLESENLQLKERLFQIDKYENLQKDYNDLCTRFENEKRLYDSKVIEVKAKNDELKEIKSEVRQFISDELNNADTNKMLRTAFDPYISNLMIEAAGNYQVESEANQYNAIFQDMQKFECKEIDKNELIDTLIEGIQKFRKYSKNEILNMYICLSQSFLTVFSGEPGTGKTSICNILAHSLGLNKFGTSGSVSMNRYVPVSVERGWSSKRDLIGYYNPLTKKYDRSNAKIYDGLMILNEEQKNSRFPYFILLDEANLSPIEYYWADFMRAADNSEGDVYINIGLDKDIYIPKTLHFLATINNDQTTEQLSPRLIDRAWIVKLPKTDVIELSDSVEDGFSNVVLWSDIEKAFVYSDAKEMSLKTIADQIYKLFDENHLTVSPRVQQSIKKYVCVAQEIMEDEIGGSNKKEKALDFAIVQKLLPKINGYYKDYERLFASLTQICDENHLYMTKKALISMEEFQRQNMGYCQYLV